MIRQANVDDIPDMLASRAERPYTQEGWMLEGYGANGDAIYRLEIGCESGEPADGQS